MGDFTGAILSPETCREAEAILAGGPVGGAGQESEATALLTALGYRDGIGTDSEGPETLANRQALLRLAGRLRRLFGISPPDAPNLIFLGGEADAGPTACGDQPRRTISLAGAGLTLHQAFERCVGEGAEYLSQIASEADIVGRGRPSEFPHGLDHTALPDVLAMLAGNAEEADPEIDWVAGRCLGGTGQIRLPADLCLRRPEAECEARPLVNVGSGCAGGPTEETATIAAVLELIERDAVALWWEGGKPARPISVEVGAAVGAGALLRQARGDATTRHSWLLDITTDLGIPCVASVSLTTDGSGFACGLAAGLSIGSAIRSAIVEMCQMELSHHIVALKRRQRGDAALNRHDLAQIDRARLIDAGTPAIHPKGLPNNWPGLSDNSADTELSFQGLLQRIEELSVSIYVVNLTRNRLAIPVSKVIAAGLQPYPSEVKTSRLKKSIRQYGVTKKSTPAIPLL